MERKWWTLIVVCTATFMLLLDITIVNVALPSMAKELGASFSDIQWVVDAYALTLASLLLTAGALADLIGRRLVFAVGLALFTLTSLLCAVSPSATFLILARGGQGVGGAIMFATSLSLLAQEFQGRERGTAFAAWGATIGAAAAIGPLVGGVLVQAFGWASIFYLNVPIGIAAIALTMTKVAESRNPAGTAIDWVGTVTFTAALFMIIFAVIEGDTKGWGSTEIVALLLGGGAELVVFFLAQLTGDHAMLDLSLFRKPAFAGGAIVAFAVSCAMFAMFLYLTLYLQTILDLSPLETGLRFLPITALSFIVAAGSGNLSARVPIRVLLGVGLVLVGAGLLLMRGLSAGSHWTALLAGFVVGGAGVGLINPALASTAVGVVPPQRSGMASGINTTFRQLGIATGIAVFGAIFQTAIASRLSTGLAGTPAGAHISQIAKAVAGGAAQSVLGSVPARSRAHATTVIHGAFTGALNEILLVAGIVALAGAVLALVLVRGSDFVGYGAPEPAHAAAATAG
ncbi:MAG TPA: MFS transporter [Solirubrobacteraceae bacterium]